jgi:hypothetical protein
VALRPLRQVRAVALPPDVRVELAYLCGPALVDRLRGVLRGVGGDHVHEQAGDHGVGPAAGDLPEVGGEPASAPHEPERARQDHACGGTDRMRVAREVAAGELGRAGRCLGRIAGAGDGEQRVGQLLCGRDRWRPAVLAAQATGAVWPVVELVARRSRAPLLACALLRGALLAIPLAHPCPPMAVGVVAEG